MENQNQNTGAKKILIIDHDQDITSEIRSAFDQYGGNDIEPIFVGGVNEALKKMAEIKVDLIILEIILPIINGYYFLDYLRSQNEAKNILVYTRLKSPEDLKKIASYEPSQLLLKQLTKPESLIHYLSPTDKKIDFPTYIEQLQSELKAISSDDSGQSAKVLQCPRCHIILNRNSHFCNNCGQKLIKNMAAVGSKKQITKVSQNSTSKKSK